MKILSHAFVCCAALSMHTELYSLLPATTRRLAPQQTKALLFNSSTKSNPRYLSYQPRTTRLNESSLRKTAQLSRNPYIPQAFSNKLYSFTKYVRQFFSGVTADDLIEDIKKDPLKEIDNFIQFIKKNNQSAVNDLFDSLLIFDKQEKDNEIEFLAVVAVQLNLQLIPNAFIIEKISHWISKNFMNLLQLQLNSEGKEDLASFILYIMTLSAYNQTGEIQTDLVSTIQKNLDSICQNDVGLLLLDYMPAKSKNLSRDTSSMHSLRLGFQMNKLWNEKILPTMKENYNRLEPILQQTPRGTNILKMIKPNPTIKE